MKISKKKIDCILSLGGGPIGAGWTSFFLYKGFQVKSYLHNKSEKDDFLSMINSALEILLEKENISKVICKNLELVFDIKNATKSVNFVQESSPEILKVKQKLYVLLDRYLSSDIIIASSTSGLKMTEIQKNMTYPERAVVAHPFNPPYLLRLVEISGGKKTSHKTIEFVFKFFKKLDKKPLIINNEIPGFIATRLQEAIWREALHMILKDGVKPQEIDFALKHGPALRLAIQGQCMAFHVACGEGGMEKNLNQFGPSLNLPWTRLKAPPLTKELKSTLINSCETMSKGNSFKKLAKQRDRYLIKLLKKSKNFRL